MQCGECFQTVVKRLQALITNCVYVTRLLYRCLFRGKSGKLVIKPRFMIAICMFETLLEICFDLQISRQPYIRFLGNPVEPSIVWSCGWYIWDTRVCYYATTSSPFLWLVRRRWIAVSKTKFTCDLEKLYNMGNVTYISGKKSDASFCKEDREGIPGFDKISVEMFQR